MEIPRGRAPVAPEAMREAREKAGITQANAAHRLGVSERAVRAWESGATATMSSEALVRLAHMYGVHTKRLMLAERKGVQVR